MKILGLEVHPAALAMPAMPDEEFAVLRADIERQGLICPIELHKGKLIDGIHRAKACKELGITPDEVDAGDLRGLSPTDYVVSLNFARRHLTASQKAAIAAELLPQYEEEAKARQTASLKQNAGGDTVPAKLPERENGEARAQAATAVGVSPRYVSDAKKLKEEAPEEFAAVKAGEKSLSEAKRDAKPPAKEKPVKNGKPIVGSPYKKKLEDSVGKLIRTLDEAGIYSQVEAECNTIAEVIDRV